MLRNYRSRHGFRVLVMRCIAVAAIAALLALSAPVQAGVVIAISKSQQQMTVSVDGQPTYHWTVSTGRPGYDTPIGGFGAIRMERVYFSKKYDDAPMPNAVFFYGGYAIHGTFEESRLGNPVSHGCVRLARANAETLFALVRERGMSNTRIEISDGPSRYSPPPTPMARLHAPGFEHFGTSRNREPRASHVSEPRYVSRAVVERRRPSRETSQESSREAWLRSLDRKYGVNSR